MTERRSIEMVDDEVFVVGQHASLSNLRAAHLVDEDADHVRPQCCQGNRPDRQWKTARRHELPLSVSGVCRECDPEVELDHTNQEGRRLYDLISDPDIRSVDDVQGVLGE